LLPLGRGVTAAATLNRLVPRNEQTDTQASDRAPSNVQNADERNRICCTDVPTDPDCRIWAPVIESHYAEGMSLDAQARHPIALVEFPADDPEQALRFWVGLLGVDLQQRDAGEGEGWQTHSGQTELGIHRRGAGPGDRFSLPYFSVPDLSAALRKVEELGGSVIHPRPPWAICRDSEGNPFALMAAAQQRQ
jgi:predicted enzyme related to lactoylglutathione lyase